MAFSGCIDQRLASNSKSGGEPDFLGFPNRWKSDSP
jgi:hypothetical protein